MSSAKAKLEVALLTVSLALLCGAAAAAQESAAQRLPSEARRLLDRATLCEHLAGEYTAVGSARNAEVSEAMRQNRCDFLSQELASLKRKYANDPLVIKKIAEFESKAEK